MIIIVYHCAIIVISMSNNMTLCSLSSHWSISWSILGVKSPSSSVLTMRCEHRELKPVEYLCHPQKVDVKDSVRGTFLGGNVWGL